MILGPLNQDATWKIICTFAFDQQEGPNEQKDEILKALENIDPRLCRPLYAALLGDAIREGRQYSSLGTLETLIDILEREEQRFWIPQWNLDRISEEDRDNDKDILAVATMAGGIDMQSNSLPEDIKAMIKRARLLPRRYARMAAGSTDTRLRPLTPDIIGEAFVLQWLKPDNPLRTERLKRIKRMARSLSAVNTREFLHRAETDFPTHSIWPYLRD